MSGKVVRFYLEEEEVRALVELAQRECRDLNRQAHWIVRQAIMKSRQEKDVYYQPFSADDLESAFSSDIKPLFGNDEIA